MISDSYLLWGLHSQERRNECMTLDYEILPCELIMITSGYRHRRNIMLIHTACSIRAVRMTGFGPATQSLEGSRSIH